MISQCWLHIGTEKTGTTSLQNYLAQNRDALLSQGYLYPRTPGALVHIALTAYCLDDSRFEGTRRRLGLVRPDDLPAFRGDFLKALDEEAAASGASAIIFSNELLSSRLRTAGELRRLKQVCDSIAKMNTKVIVYLRNQVDFLASRYTNVVVGGSTEGFRFQGATRLTDYAALLAPWAEIFGRENMIVRRYESCDFRSSDLLKDFAGVAGFDDGPLIPLPRLNESLNAQSIAFLRAFNSLLRPLGEKRAAPWRGRIVTILQMRQRGDRFTIPLQLARTIEDSFRESNERISADYFDARFHPLFSPPHAVAPANSDSNYRIGVPGALRVTAWLVSGGACLLAAALRPPRPRPTG